MNANETDIFISYRRIDGRDVARNIHLALGKEGYENVFFDYSSLREGMFNEQIITAINHCKDYILVLSPQSMLRCNDPNDWVAKELQTAIDAGCKIIPVQINEPFNAWPQDFPKKFNFIKQIEFLTLRTDEYFQDSIRRLIGWLDSKPTRAHEASIEFWLNIHVDETCELFIDGERIRKIKGGKSAKIEIPNAEQTYSLKFASLAQRGCNIELSYTCPANSTQKEDDIEVSFLQIREQKENTTKHQKAESKRKKEEARQKEWKLMQACGNYDAYADLIDGMVGVFLNDKLGYLNESGFEAVACEYDDGNVFCGGYTTVCKNGKWGIIDKIGQIVVPLLSDTPCWPQGNYDYFIASQNNHFAISTISRGFPSTFIYDEVKIFGEHENLFAVKKGELWTIIDATGAPSPFTLQVKMKFYGSSYSYQNKWEDPIYIHTPLRVQHPVTNRWGYLNNKLKLTIPFVDEGSREETYYSDLEIIKTNGRMGLVNIETGVSIIPAIYDNVHQFDYGEPFDFFRVADGSTCYSKDCKEGFDTRRLYGGMQGVVNIQGENIVPQQYQRVEILVYYPDKPIFLAYILRDLHLSWGEPLLGSQYLKVRFDERNSEIHIYSSKGMVITKLNYTEESKIYDKKSKIKELIDDALLL